MAYQSTIRHIRVVVNDNGTRSYRATVESYGTMGKRKGERELLTGVILRRQSLKKQIRHHASVRGFGHTKITGMVSYEPPMTGHAETGPRLHHHRGAVRG